MNFIQAYNAASVGCWVATVGCLLADHYRLGHAGGLAIVATTWSQVFNLLDIVLAALKLTHSSVQPAVLQSASRLLSLYCLARLGYGGRHGSPIFVSTLLAAWAIADALRYMYYAVGGRRLEQARYSWFMLLYPVGFVSELAIIYKAYSQSHSTKYLLLLLAWPIGFYYMFSHMLKQRARLWKRTKKQ